MVPPAGVFFGANAVRAMSLINPALAEAYPQISTGAGWDSKKNTYFDFVLGQELHGLPAGTNIASPQIDAREGHSTTHRAHFIDELGRLIPEELAEFGKRLYNITRDETRGRTIMKFSDGTTAEADVVVGCDGIRSMCRNFVLGKDNPLAQPQFTGKHAYRGLIPMDKAIEAIGEEKARNRHMFLGKHGHILVFPIAHGQTMNVVAFRSSKDGKWEGNWVKPAERDEMLEDFKDFGEDCQKILSVCGYKWVAFKAPTAHNITAYGKDRQLGDFRSF